jgi:hypothetical protein
LFDTLREADMTVSEPNGQPDIERPIDLNDDPESGTRAKPAPTPQHHPDEPGLPGENVAAPATEDPSVD